MAQQKPVSIGQRFATPFPKNHKTRRWAKRRRTQMFINGHTKRSAKLGISSEKAGLGDHAECRQPHQLREQILSGKLKMGLRNGCARPVKQSPECHLVNIVREREQE